MAATASSNLPMRLLLLCSVAFVLGPNDADASSYIQYLIEPLQKVVTHPGTTYNTW